MAARLDHEGNTEVFQIWDERWDTLQAKLAKVNKRAEKLGAPPVEVLVVSMDLVTKKHVWQGHEWETGHLVRNVIVFGESPTIPGYTFAAAVDFESAGNIVNLLPDFQNDNTFDASVLYDIDPKRCDHCKAARRRKQAFALVQDDTDELFVVGRSCLGDFLGAWGMDPKLITGRFAGLREITAMCGDLDDDEPRAYCGGPRHLEVDAFAQWVAMAIRKHGWLSKGNAARYGTDENPKYSSNEMAEYHEMAWKDRNKTDRRGNLLYPNATEPTDEDKACAKAALEWIRSGTVEHDHGYISNLLVACAEQFAKFKHQGLVASVFIAWSKATGNDLPGHLDRQAAREAAQLERQKSTHQGEVKKRMALELIVLNVRDMSQEWPSFLCTFEDKDGNRFKWWASRSNFAKDSEGHRREAVIGETLIVKGTVKKHEEFQGVKETVLTRVAHAGDPAPKQELEYNESPETLSAF